MYSCSSDDDDNGGSGSDKVTIKATVKCELDGQYVADAGAKLYLFLNFTNTADYEYQEGTFVNKTNGGVVNHARRELVNGQGLINFEIDPGEKSIIVVESARYTGKYKQSIHELKKGTTVDLGEIKFQP